VKGADPEVLDHFPVDATPQLPLFRRRQGAPGLAELALGQLLGQQQLQPLFLQFILIKFHIPELEIIQNSGLSYSDYLHLVD
jgi:hypothetical protein